MIRYEKNHQPPADALEEDEFVCTYMSVFWFFVHICDFKIVKIT